MLEFQALGEIRVEMQIALIPPARSICSSGSQLTPKHVNTWDVFIL
jgi:hypothetical protein